MVKIKGPMMSMAASGTLADAITFSTWKGRPYVRETVKPSNPKSGDQVGRREMFSFLTKIWASISDADQATWQDLADQLVASRFNAFLSYNMEEWHNFKAPSSLLPATRVAGPATTATVAASYVGNRCKIDLTQAMHFNGMGLIVFHSLSAVFTPAVGNAIIVTTDDIVGAFSLYWTPPSITPLRYFNIKTFSDDGNISAAGTERTCSP